MTSLNIQLLLTGNELMSGDITDTNSVMLAKKFQDLGLNITRKVTIADSYNMLVNEIIDLSHQADILLINGGLGPTTDDLTAKALAQAMNCQLAENSHARQHLELWAKQRNAPLTAANLKQAQLPTSSSIIKNSIGSAVGIQATLNQCEIYCTPGVPSELKVMFTEQIMPDIQQRFATNASIHTTRLHVFGYGESRLQELINQHFPQWPESIFIGFRAEMPLLELKLTTFTEHHLTLKQQYLEKLHQVLGDHIIEEINQQPKTLAEHVITQLGQRNLTLTTAESCTGGLIASQLTEIAGSSQVFEAGFVTYSNAMKNLLLGVSEQTLAKYGAVSEQTVIAMAQGALKITKADIAVAVSGIAGPTGGSEEKPVGTVWLALATKEKVDTILFTINGNRKYVQKTVAARAFDLIRRLLIDSEQQPIYLTNHKK